MERVRIEIALARAEAAYPNVPVRLYTALYPNICQGEHVTCGGVLFLALADLLLGLRVVQRDVAAVMNHLADELLVDPPENDTRMLLIVDQHFIRLGLTAEDCPFLDLIRGVVVEQVIPPVLTTAVALSELYSRTLATFERLGATAEESSAGLSPAPTGALRILPQPAQ